MTGGFRRFELHRRRDVSGVSGTGVVAEGVQFTTPFQVVFPDGQVSTLPPGWVRIDWLGEYRSTVLWHSFDAAVAVHGHGGATEFVWLDGL